MLRKGRSIEICVVKHNGRKRVHESRFSLESVLHTGVSVKYSDIRIKAIHINQ